MNAHAPANQRRTEKSSATYTCAPSQNRTLLMSSARVFAESFETHRFNEVQGIVEVAVAQAPPALGSGGHAHRNLRHL